MEKLAPPALAGLLAHAKVHRQAARRLDDLDRFCEQHQQSRKAQVKTVLGTLGIVLGIGPTVPDVWSTCRASDRWHCGTRLAALVGSAIALGVTLWSAYDLFTHGQSLAAQVRRLDQELARSMRAKRCDPLLEDFFSRYQRMHPEERQSLKALLHEHIARPEPVSSAA